MAYKGIQKKLGGAVAVLAGRVRDELVMSDDLEDSAGPGDPSRFLAKKPASSESPASTPETPVAAAVETTVASASASSPVSTSPAVGAGDGLFFTLKTTRKEQFVELCTAIVNQEHYAVKDLDPAQHLAALKGFRMEILQEIFNGGSLYERYKPTGSGVGAPVIDVLGEKMPVSETLATGLQVLSDKINALQKAVDGPSRSRVSRFSSSEGAATGGAGGPASSLAFGAATHGLGGGTPAVNDAKARSASLSSTSTRSA